ncbi:MAG: DUF2634 domain-containing protein, partial [Christensenella sp.]
MNEYPFLNPRTNDKTENSLYRDIAWDYERNRPIYHGSRPLIITGHKAVMSWAWRALNTVRHSKVAYSDKYGNEVEALLGKQWTRNTRIAETKRYIMETLKLNPYILGINDFEVNFEKSSLTV